MSNALKAADVQPTPSIPDPSLVVLDPRPLPVPGRVGTQLQSLLGSLEAWQFTEHGGAHKSWSGTTEGAHFVELNGQEGSKASGHKSR